MSCHLGASTKYRTYAFMKWRSCLDYFYLNRLICLWSQGHYKTGYFWHWLINERHFLWLWMLYWRCHLEDHKLIQSVYFWSSCHIITCWKKVILIQTGFYIYEISATLIWWKVTLIWSLINIYIFFTSLLSKKKVNDIQYLKSKKRNLPPLSWCEVFICNDWSFHLLV